MKTGDFVYRISKGLIVHEKIIKTKKEKFYFESMKTGDPGIPSYQCFETIDELKWNLEYDYIKEHLKEINICINDNKTHSDKGYYWDEWTLNGNKIDDTMNFSFSCSRCFSYYGYECASYSMTLFNIYNTSKLSLEFAIELRDFIERHLEEEKIHVV